MIVDVHTHVFPPRMVASRAELAAADPGFAAIYAEPAARMATAEELLASMADAGVDIAVAAGFAWRSPAHAEEHAAYLLDAAERAGGRLLAFPPVPTLGRDAGADAEAIRPRLRALAAAGARGVGELRLDPAAHAAGDAAAAELARPLLDAARAQGLVPLTHSTEPTCHDYPGKEGGLSPGALWRLLDGGGPIYRAAPSWTAAPLLAAHWGGGLALYAAMPGVRALFGSGALVVDTAASRYLYDPRIFELSLALGLGSAVLWGSDYPLRSQAEDRADLERAVSDPVARAAILGGNAERLLAL